MRNSAYLTQATRQTNVMCYTSLHGLGSQRLLVRVHMNLALLFCTPLQCSAQACQAGAVAELLVPHFVFSAYRLAWANLGFPYRNA